MTAAITCVIAVTFRQRKNSSRVGMVRTAAPRSSAIWSAEDEEKLLQMRASGASFGDIAADVGRSQASVEARYSNLKKQTRLQS